MNTKLNAIDAAAVCRHGQAGDLRFSQKKLPGAGPSVAGNGRALQARARLFHFLGKYGRFIIVLTLAAALYVAFFWYQYLYASPLELYHRTWQACAQNLFDRKDLKNWKSFEHRFDRLIKSDDDAVLYANKMLSSLGDPYTYLISARRYDAIKMLRTGRFVGIGVQVSSVKKNGEYLTIANIISGTPAHRAGLKAGDIIISIAGQSCRKMSPPRFSEITREHNNESVCLLIRRKQRHIRLYLTPSTVATDNLEFKRIMPHVGLLTVHNFIKSESGPRIAKILANAKECSSLILDLRDNPGGDVADCLQVASLFLHDGPLVTLKIRTGDKIIKESHVLKADREEIISVDGDKGSASVRSTPRLPEVRQVKNLVVLVNKRTASAAEMLAGTLKENGRALVVGTKTFGKGIAQAGVPIANGAILSVTCVHYFTPAGHFLGLGRQAPGDGLKPDLLVENKSDGADAQLKRAIAALKI